ncbi:MAG TPA: sulfocyanin-like copper-binding protein [Gemmatimonadaceae bacterium]|nr:sulfocyanin-like copper-binding protein [Gemmatimonadaceae bacterium]
MRAKIPGVLALLAVTACADLYEADPAHTARADSSAAGYPVDAVTASLNPSARPDSSSTLAVRPAVRALDSGPVAVVDAPSPPPSTGTRAGAGSGGPQSGDPRVGPPESTRPPAADSAPASPNPVRDDVTLPESLGMTAIDSIVVNAFLAFDPRARTVWLDLIAGHDGSNGSLNFNGGSNGTHTLRVPLGWRVEARFANQDGELAHSAVVIREVDPMPMIAPPAAFPGAFTLSLESGLPQGERDTMRFPANERGRYMIVCGVPGHAQGGMWVRLEVGARVEAPAFGRGQGGR